MSASRAKNRMMRMLLLCALTLALHGCGGLAAQTGEKIPPVPPMPGLVVTDDFVCMPNDEAAELLLWIETVEKMK